MTEEVKEEQEPQEEPQEEVKETPPDVPPEEVEAREAGWVDQDTYASIHGEENRSKWVDAEEFNRRGQLFGKIKTQKRRIETHEMKIKELEDRISGLHQVMSKTREVVYDNARRELRAELKSAMEDGDTEKAEMLLDKAEKSAAESSPPPESKDNKPVNDPYLTAWFQKNQWYGADKDMTQSALKIGEELNKNSPYMGPEQFYEALDTELKRRHPKEFGVTSPPKKTPPVLGSGKPTGSSRGPAVKPNDLPDDLHKVYKFLTSEGQVFEGKGNDLIKEWVESGAIKVA